LLGKRKRGAITSNLLFFIPTAKHEALGYPDRERVVIKAPAKKRGTLRRRRKKEKALNEDEGYS